MSDQEQEQPIDDGGQLKPPDSGEPVEDGELAPQGDELAPPTQDVGDELIAPPEPEQSEELLSPPDAGDAIEPLAPPDAEQGIEQLSPPDVEDELIAPPEIVADDIEPFDEPSDADTEIGDWGDAPDDENDSNDYKSPEPPRLIEQTTNAKEWYWFSGTLDTATTSTYLDAPMTRWTPSAGIVGNYCYPEFPYAGRITQVRATTFRTYAGVPFSAGSVLIKVLTINATDTRAGNTANFATCTDTITLKGANEFSKAGVCDIPFNITDGLGVFATTSNDFAVVAQPAAILVGILVEPTE